MSGPVHADQAGTTSAVDGVLFANERGSLLQPVRCTTGSQLSMTVSCRVESWAPDVLQYVLVDRVESHAIA
jgi:hypothetical protein